MGGKFPLVPARHEVNLAEIMSRMRSRLGLGLQEGDSAYPREGQPGERVPECE